LGTVHSWSPGYNRLIECHDCNTHRNTEWGSNTCLCRCRPHMCCRGSRGDVLWPKSPRAIGPTEQYDCVLNAHSSHDERNSLASIGGRCIHMHHVEHRCCAVHWQQRSGAIGSRECSITRFGPRIGTRSLQRCCHSLCWCVSCLCDYAKR
jgi:hypothetical protein